MKSLTLKPFDNAGASQLQCIHVFGNGSQKKVSLGSILKVVVKKTNQIKIKRFKKVKKAVRKKKYKSIIINSKLNTARPDGSFIKFLDTSSVLLSEKNKVLGSRIKGIVPFEIKKNILALKFKKIFRCARFII